jgi:hypothetical protein
MFSDQSRRMRWAGHVPWTGDMKNGNKILARKPEEKRPFRRLGHR